MVGLLWRVWCLLSGYGPKCAADVGCVQHQNRRSDVASYSAQRAVALMVQQIARDAGRVVFNDHDLDLKNRKRVSGKANWAFNAPAIQRVDCGAPQRRLRWAPAGHVHLGPQLRSDWR